MNDRHSNLLTVQELAQRPNLRPKQVYEYHTEVRALELRVKKLEERAAKADDPVERKPNFHTSLGK